MSTPPLSTTGPRTDAARRRPHVLHTFSNESSVPYMSWFARRAAAEGRVHYSFLLMHTERPAMIDEMAALGFEARWIRYDQDHRKRGLLRTFPWMVRHMKAMRPDIVHCNLFDDTVAGLPAARMAGIPLRVMSRQDAGYHWNHAPRWVFVDKLDARLATHIIAISDEGRRHMIERERIPARKITLVHNGIPPEIYTARSPEVEERLRRRFGIGPQHLVIGTVARFIEWKGYRHIVAAAARFVQQHPEARFLFCGKGVQEPEVRALVTAAGLDEHVVFTGWVERTDMASFMGILDLYLHAADMEPFGLVYAEAMMNAVPVVTTPTGAALDAIEDGHSGIFAHERSGEGLAMALERALTYDRKAMGRAGREAAMRLYHFDRMWEGTVGLYEKALGI